MSKAFDTINIHTLIRKLLHTNIAGTIIKFIANYINGRKAYTTYINHTSSRQFKTGVLQGGVLSPTLFNSYTADIPPPRARVQPINTCNHTYKKFLHGQNNLTLNPDKVTCILLTPDPAKLKSNLDLKLTTLYYPWQRTITLTKTHIHHISVQATTNDKSTHWNRMG